MHTSFSRKCYIHTYRYGRYTSTTRRMPYVPVRADRPVPSRSVSNDASHSPRCIQLTSPTSQLYTRATTTRTSHISSYTLSYVVAALVSQHHHISPHFAIVNILSSASLRLSPPNFHRPSLSPQNFPPIVTSPPHSHGQQHG